jgi:CrcB protein
LAVIWWACSSSCPIWRLTLVTGFLGALTTFSTFSTFSSFSAEVVAMLQQGRYAFAAGTACIHLFGSLVLTVLGIKIMAMFWGR